MMTTRPPKIIKWIFLVFAGVGGILLCVAAILAYQGYHFSRTAVEIPGTVIRIDSKVDSEGITLYQPIFEYTYREETNTYPLPLWGSSQPYTLGEQTTLLMNPENPSELRVQGWYEYLWAFVAGGMGMFFFLFGMIVPFIDQRARKNITELKRSGHLIQAEITGFEPNQRITINNNHPYMAVAKPRTQFEGLPDKLTSSDYWMKIPQHLPIGQMVQVYVSMSQPKDYYMDLESLSPTSPESSPVVS